MIKVSQQENSDSSGKLDLECWNRDAQTQALRIEVSEVRCFVFPFSLMTFVCLDCSETQETLRISFTTHDVHIHGHRLRQLLNALQKMSVDWIRTIPARYQKLADSESAFVEKIEVEEIGADLPT